ncbi:MAG: hypothetical protein AAFT19_06980 [Pseudomonadota bacterium]
MLFPVFLLIQVFLYIWIVNWNIAKHGGYIEYLYREGLEPLGLGPNLYGRYMGTRHHPRFPLSRWLDVGALHASQGVLLVLSVGCVVLYVYVEGQTGFAPLVACPTG